MFYPEMAPDMLEQKIVARPYNSINLKIVKSDGIDEM